jgi:hypothetical protein
MKINSLKIFLMFCAVWALVSCRKDIDVPSSECSQVFGSWRFVLSEGGMTGKDVITEQSRGYTETVTFTKKGIAHWYKNGKKRRPKSKFSFKVANSIYTNAPSSQLVMDGENMTIRFSGNGDTLHLLQEATDSYHTVYVKQ